MDMKMQLFFRDDLPLNAQFRGQNWVIDFSDQAKSMILGPKMPIYGQNPV
jgi:hypothetical protein